VSCCNPRGPSPGALAVTVGIVVVLFVICGGPLAALASVLWSSAGLGWWLLVAGLAIAAIAAPVIASARRRLDDRFQGIRRRVALRRALKGAQDRRAYPTPNRRFAWTPTWTPLRPHSMPVPTIC